jgi:hypothetical protein
MVIITWPVSSAVTCCLSRSICFSRRVGCPDSQNTVFWVSCDDFSVYLPVR